MKKPSLSFAIDGSGASSGGLALPSSGVSVNCFCSACNGSTPSPWATRNLPQSHTLLVDTSISYTTSDAWTFALNTESTYDWKAEQWSVPINFQVSKLVKFGKQPVNLTAGARYWATAPENVPDGWGFRVAMTFLFPK